MSTDMHTHTHRDTDKMFTPLFARGKREVYSLVTLYLMFLYIADWSIPQEIFHFLLYLSEKFCKCHCKTSIFPEKEWTAHVVTGCANKNFQKTDQESRTCSLIQSGNLRKKDLKSLAPTALISIECARLCVSGLFRAFWVLCIFIGLKADFSFCI